MWNCWVVDKKEDMVDLMDPQRFALARVITNYFDKGTPVSVQRIFSSMLPTIAHAIVSLASNQLQSFVSHGNNQSYLTGQALSCLTLLHLLAPGFAILQTRHRSKILY